MPSRTGEQSRTRIARALIVQEFGPDDVDALDYLGQTSRADTEARTTETQL